MKIAVLGAGSWGTALAKVLSENNHEVSLWGRNEVQMAEMTATGMNQKYLPGVTLKDSILMTSNFETAVSNANVYVLAVASQSVREIVYQLKKYTGIRPLIVNVTKGVEVDTLKRISEVVLEIIPDANFVALSGPSHAEEVSKGIPTTLVSSSVDKEAAELIQDLFGNENLRIYTNPDVVGVELGGALKNIIALGAGISDGLGFGDNSKAALMTRGISEIGRLGKIMGADVDTFKGLSGIGDLIVTCTSMHSRNRRFGILVGQGMSVPEALKEIGMVVEGYYTIKSAYYLSQKFDVDMPITRELYRVLYEGSDARTSVRNLMLRSLKHEMEETVDAKHFWEESKM